MWKYDVELKQAEDEAKNAKRGIWSNACQQKKENCVIKGNYRADNNTYIYHLPNCYNYERIVVNEKKGIVGFVPMMKRKKQDL